MALTTVSPTSCARAARLAMAVAVVAAAFLILARPAAAGEAGAGHVRLVSHVPGQPTTTANSASSAPSTSADGRVVVFESSATNLVPGQVDTNRFEDVFLYDRSTGAVTLVSHTPFGASGDVPLPPPDAIRRFFAPHP